MGRGPSPPLATDHRTPMSQAWARAGPAGAPRPAGHRPLRGATGGGEGSRAIRDVAIVAIWAGVLIPRWLRRDSSASSAGELADDGRTAAEPGPAVTEEPAPRSRHRPDAVRPPVRPEGPAA